MFYGIIRCGLFTDVSLYKIIKICINEIFKSEETVSCLNKKEMFEMFSVLLLSVLSKQCFCSITNITVKLTNLPWMLSYYLNDFRPVSYKRYDEIDIFVLLETSLNDTSDSGNLMDYLPLVWKESLTDMHDLVVYVKEGVPFAWDLSLKNSADSYLYF